jgi:threonine synthase
MRLTSANSVNVGRLLPQMVYYFHALAQLRANGDDTSTGDPVVCTPSGNFGNLTAGLMAKRAGLPVARFVAATNANDVVPEYLETGRFEPRASVRTLTNAMDVGHPSNFERMSWLYGGDLDAMRHDIAGSRHADDDVRDAIRRVYETRGYLLDPHSAVAYLGLTGQAGQVGRVGQVGQVGQVGRAGQAGRPGILLATAHPAKFAEIVEPIINRAVEKPAPLTQALARPRHIIRIESTLTAVKAALGA